MQHLLQYKYCYRFLKEKHIFLKKRVGPNSFLELRAAATDQPADLQTVEKRLAALRDKMEGDANRINHAAALLDRR